MLLPMAMAGVFVCFCLISYCIGCHLKDEETTRKRVYEEEDDLEVFVDSLGEGLCSWEAGLPLVGLIRIGVT